MKYIKSCAAALLALAAVQAASAATITVRLTGSSAYRSATITQINLLFNSTNLDRAQSNATLTSANYVTWRCQLAGNTTDTYIVQCAFTGSVEGIRDVSNQQNQRFIPVSIFADTTASETISSGAGVTVNSTTGLLESTSPAYELAVPQIAMADNVQAITTYRTNSLTENRVGVVPFVFVRGNLTASHPGKAGFDSITNITSQQAKVLLTGGLPLSMFTGATDSAAVKTKIYAVGRNPLSGTRVVTFAETGFGTTSTATQVQPSYSGNNITSINYTDIDGVGAFGAGDDGYISGGTLATDLGKTVTDLNGSGNNIDPGLAFGLIGYVSANDAGNVIKSTDGGVANVLAYNGQSLAVTKVGSTVTWDFTAIKQGKYTLWSYEYLSYLPSLSGAQLTFATTLRDNLISNVSEPAGIKLADLTATGIQRAYEGAVVTK